MLLLLVDGAETPSDVDLSSPEAKFKPVSTGSSSEGEGSTKQLLADFLI